jgi:DNA-directed RNA polymerase I, II, and III subunit RPABC1
MTQLREIAKAEGVKSASKKSKIIKNIVDTVEEKKIEDHFKGYSQVGKFQIESHILVPVFKRLSDEDVKTLIEQYNLKRTDLPKILLTDPMAIYLAAVIGDVIEITRKSKTSGEHKYYRVVVPV